MALRSYIHGTKIASVVVIENGDQQLAKDMLCISLHHNLIMFRYQYPEDVIDEEKDAHKTVEDEGKL